MITNIPGPVRVLVTGVTERKGEAWDLLCHVIAASREWPEEINNGGHIQVDPFVSCAWPVGTDADRRALIGREFLMSDFQVHKSGCYLPEKFEPVEGVPAPAPVRILYTHPGTSCYHDNAIWVSIGSMDDHSDGIWLKPGEALAVVNLPQEAKK
jgi:hypothetical protein